MATRYINDVAGDRSQYFARELIEVLMLNEFDHDAAMRAVAEAHQAGHTYVDVIDGANVLKERDLPVRKDNVRAVVAGFLRAEADVDKVLDAADRGVYVYANDVAAVTLYALLGGDADAARVFDYEGYNQDWKSSITTHIAKLSFGWGHGALRADDSNRGTVLALLGEGMDRLDDTTAVTKFLDHVMGDLAPDLNRDTGKSGSALTDLFEFVAQRGEPSITARASRALLALNRGEDLVEVGVITPADSSVGAIKNAYARLAVESRDADFSLSGGYRRRDLTSNEVLKPMGFTRRERRDLRAQVLDKY
jgi:hypothetical protein